MVQEPNKIRCFWCGRVLNRVPVYEDEWSSGIKKIYRTHECPEVHCSIRLIEETNIVESYTIFLFIGSDRFNNTTIISKGEYIGDIILKLDRLLDITPNTFPEFVEGKLKLYTVFS